MDYWFTLVRDLGKIPGPLWLEPCAGNGNIIHAFESYPKPTGLPEIRWKAVELREESEAHLRKLLPKKSIVCPRNFFEYAALAKTRFNVTITNPPYRVAQEFIEHSLQITDGLVIMLLRVNYTGSSKRWQFFKNNRPARILLLPNRPCFTDDGKTDSIEYAWFVWDTTKPNVDTIFEWLDLTTKEVRLYSPNVVIAP